MIITGTLPLILYNEIEDKENIIGKGTDIDITLREQGKETYISATILGNGKWEIEELDDNANLLPEYDVGDVISFDVLKKILVTRKEVLTSSNQIFSFNLLGKVKYGLQDAEKDFKKKVNRKTDKAKGMFKGVKDWFTDDLDAATAQEYIRKYYPGANVGEIEKINDIDGATFKVLFGVPSEEKFYVGCLHRNGNDIRFLDDDDSPDTPLYSFTDAEEANKAFNNYPKLEGTDEDPDNPEQSDNSEQSETEITEETLEDNSNKLGEEQQVTRPGTSGESDGVQWEVTQGLKKKKSKYNGKNVTGYQDGMLGEMTVASHKLFSTCLIDIE